MSTALLRLVAVVGGMSLGAGCIADRSSSGERLLEDVSFQIPPTLSPPIHVHHPLHGELSAPEEGGLDSDFCLFASTIRDDRFVLVLGSGYFFGDPIPAAADRLPSIVSWFEKQARTTGSSLSLETESELRRGTTPGKCFVQKYSAPGDATALQVVRLFLLGQQFVIESVSTTDDAASPEQLGELLDSCHVGWTFSGSGLLE